MSDLILGPQLSPTASWLDRTLIAKARQYGETCPTDPPTDDNGLNSFILLHYYDLPLGLYIAHKRTSDPALLSLARRAADSWWKHPTWIDQGAKRLFPDSPTPAPRHAGIGGLILRALDGRPEMWDWIVEYVKANLDIWLKSHINDRELYIGLREGAFALHHAVWLASALPNSYPRQRDGVSVDGAHTKAQLLADVEAICLNYYGRLQRADGSWRWGNAVNEYGDTKFTLAASALAGFTTLSLVDPVPEAIPQGELIWINGRDLLLRVVAPVPVGSKAIPVQQRVWNDALQRFEWKPLQQDLPAGTVGQYAPMVGIMQPFMVGLLLSALCDAHQLVVAPTVKESIKKQILTGCSFIYEEAYTRLVPVKFGVSVRGFHYFYGGGTTINPTKYATGDLTTENITEAWHISSARQAISTILPAFGYAYKISGDGWFKTAGAEMFDSAYGGSDGFRAMLDDTAKNYNQHARRVGSYLAWTGTPAPPQPGDPAMPLPSPDGTKAISIVDSSGATWSFGPRSQTFRNGLPAGGGQGTVYKYLGGVVWVLGLDTPTPCWYSWVGNAWARKVALPSVEPGLPEPPAPTDPFLGVTWPSSAGEALALLTKMRGRGYRFLTESGGTAYFERAQ